MSSFFGLFKRKSAGYQLADVYVKLRSQVLASAPSAPSPEAVWGVVMETGYDEAVASVVALADDTVSMYFSNGGGCIGLGGQEGPRTAGRALLALAPRFVNYCQPSVQFPLPAKGNTRFFILTRNGVFTAEVSEADLGYQRHPLSPLFHKTQELITEIRKADEATKSAKP